MPNLHIQTGGEDPDSLEVIFRELIDIYGPKAEIYCKHKYSNLSRTDVDDILMIAVGKLWRKFRNYDPARGPLQIYFARIVVRVAYDYAIDKMKLDEVSFDDTKYPRIADERATERHENADQELGQKDKITDLMKIIESLPRQKREILLCFIERSGGTNTGWTEGLDRSIGKTKSYIRVVCHRTIRHVGREMRRLGW